jgi:hypothetical protein
MMAIAHRMANGDGVHDAPGDLGIECRNALIHDSHWSNSHSGDAAIISATRPPIEIDDGPVKAFPCPFREEHQFRSIMRRILPFFYRGPGIAKNSDRKSSQLHLVLLVISFRHNVTSIVMCLRGNRFRESSAKFFPTHFDVD